MSGDGSIVEALGGGVNRRHIDRYAGTEYTVVRIDAAEPDRRQAVEFAEWSLGQPYGWTVIASIAVSLLTGAKFSFGYEGQHICSGLVARALERTGVIFNRTPSHITPADLAKFFSVVVPPPSVPKGEVPPP